MKKIIIFLLLVLVALYGFNTYKTFKRFSIDNYGYKMKEIPSSVDQSLVQEYYTAVEKLDGFIVRQWSQNGIDVRNPKKDNEIINTAVTIYQEKLAYVKYIESKIGEDEFKNVSLREEQKKNKIAQSNHDAIKTLFELSKRELRNGDKGVLVYELQRALNKKGANLKLDGVFQEGTFSALKEFESKEGLYPDGILDYLTLEYLLR